MTRLSGLGIVADSSTMERRGYGFSNEAKQYVHSRAGKNCEYGGGDCPNPNTGRVNHITGAFEGYLKGAEKRDISNPEMNATMECSVHESVHDAQERLQVQSLKGEHILYERRIGETNRRRNRRVNPYHRRGSSRKRR